MTSKYFVVLGSIVLAILTAAPPTCTAATVETARANTIPWSGYWWPTREGRMLLPLRKYDALTGSKATEWEKQQHPAGASVPKWWGYCHAWAASAVLEPEPRKATQQRTRGQAVTLTSGDQKGLLAVCHSNDVSHSYGSRFEEGSSSEERLDLAPDQLWRLLNLYVKQRGVPLVLDTEAGAEVWNYPIYEYRVEYDSTGEGTQQQARLTLLMADDAVQPDYLGVKVRKQIYNFTFNLQNGSVEMGSARWIGHSAEDHPDFAWYPYIVRGENTEVDYATVKKLIAQRPTTTPVRPAEEPVAVENQPSPPTGNNVAGELPAIASRPGESILLSPLELVALVTDKSPSFGLDVTVDQFDGGRYLEGENYTVRGSSAKDGYLYLLHVDPLGNLSLLYPIQGQDNRVKGKRSFSLPPKDSKFAYRAVGPPGQNYIKAIVTSKPLRLSGANWAMQPAQDERRQRDQRNKPTLVQGFRWHPTQVRLLSQHLQRQQQGNRLHLEQLNTFNPKQLLGEFSQDEITFFVDRKVPSRIPGNRQNRPNSKPN